MLYSSSALAFGAGTALFNASITFVTPYFIALLAAIIPYGFGVSAANIATLAGFSTGPFLVSFLVAGDDFRPTIMLTAAGFVLVCGMVVSFSRALKNSTLAQERIARLIASPKGTQKI